MITFLKRCFDCTQPTVFSPIAISNSIAAIISGIEPSLMEEIHDQLYFCCICNHKKDENFCAYTCLFYNRNLLLLPAFNESVKLANCDLQGIDFSDVSRAYLEINKLVCQKTQGRIKEILKSTESLTNVNICLGSIATLSEQWSYPFDDAGAATFYSQPPKKIDMIFIKKGHGFRYKETEFWSCLSIPYKGWKRWFNILLPKKNNGFEELLKQFDDVMIRDCINGLPVDANATFPCFEITSTVTFNDNMKPQNLKSLFEKSKFTKVFDDPSSYSLDMLVHATKMKIDKYGTYASPFVDDGLRTDVRYREITFVADHPFIFFITLFEKMQYKSTEFVGTFV